MAGSLRVSAGPARICRRRSSASSPSPVINAARASSKRRWAMSTRARAQRAAVCAGPGSVNRMLHRAAARRRRDGHRSATRAPFDELARSGHHVVDAAFMHLVCSGRQPRTPGAIAGCRPNDEVRPGIFRGEAEQRQRGIRRQPGVGGKYHNRSVLEPRRPSPPACASTAPSASARGARSRPGVLRAPAGGESGPSLPARLDEVESSRPAVTRIGQRGPERVERCRRRGSPARSSDRSHTSMRECPRASKSINHARARVVKSGGMGLADPRRMCQRIPRRGQIERAAAETR